MKKLIETQNLTKIFYDAKRGEIPAADDVNFDCYAGEIFGLLGPNGAGKTTTLRLLSTILKPTSGTAKINGHDVIKDAHSVRSSIGFLSSNTGLYDRLTPQETLEYFGRLNRVDETNLQNRIKELVSLLDMEEFMNVHYEKLSTGMKQKTSIARAIIHDPPVLIFDEPTMGLDILIASAMIKFINRCKEENKCVIFSTHIMSEAEKLCDKIAIIHQGKILAIGTLDELRILTNKTYLEDIFITLVKD